VSALSLANLGLAEQSTSVLPAEDIHKLAATLDVSIGPKEPLPLLWHWAFFNPIVSTDRLGPDGHPRRESALLKDYPRRMWVGGEVTSTGSLYPDTATVRRTRLVKHAEKRGSSGNLLIVTLEHAVEQSANIVLVERQDVIFREAGGSTPPEGPEVTPPAAAGWRETFEPTVPLLFRFSAATFNSHRIHYDHDYATNVERYPGLVVHGPLTAMMLAESASRHLGRPLASFSYRASNPVFVDRPITIDGEINAEPHGPTATVVARRMDGAIAMTATAAAAAPRG
jgi:hydroxyacyl-ACP dehydratase HTD2-like protein with hotdog domain